MRTLLFALVTGSAITGIGPTAHDRIVGYARLALFLGLAVAAGYDRAIARKEKRT